MYIVYVCIYSSIIAVSTVLAAGIMHYQLVMVSLVYWSTFHKEFVIILIRNKAVKVNNWIGVLAVQLIH